MLRFGGLSVGVGSLVQLRKAQTARFLRECHKLSDTSGFTKMGIRFGKKAPKTAGQDGLKRDGAPVAPTIAHQWAGPAPSVSPEVAVLLKRIAYRLREPY
jgi:hypothetical protein